MLCILAFIGGCTPTSNTNYPEAVKSVISKSDISGREQALSLMLTADLSSANPQADSLRLKIADLFASDSDHQNALDILQLIDTQKLNNQEFVDYSFLLAETKVALYNLESAIEHLEQLRFMALSSEFKKSDIQRLSEIQSKLAFAKGDHYQGLQILIDLAESVKRKSDIQDIHDKILQHISHLPYQQLTAGMEHRDVTLAGWLQLGEALRRKQGSPKLSSNAYEQWRQRWKNHPAAKVEPTNINRNSRRQNTPSQLALLLPLQDEYKIPSYTLIEGFLEAYYKTILESTYEQEMAPEIRIYDTSTGSIQSIYNQAVAEGADIVIGPLRQSQVESLTSAPLLPVPTIALNRLDKENTPQPENFYQFGLSSLDELTHIADRAWRKGLRKVLLITPDNSWGVHSAKFFSNYWVGKGGTLLQEVTYSSTTNDFTQLLKPSLQIDLSEQRGLQIKRFVNSSVNYTVRRRQDIDLVIMLGYPLKARQIKPALDFLYASDVPVVATSHIYNGDHQEQFDRDLSGIEFSSMPWTLKGHLPYVLNVDEKLHTAYRHLYALGHDAFLLYGNLNELTNSDSLTVYGATGLLSLKENILIRTPKWAIFERGKVRETQY